jgi:histidinol-phosphate aminotransferase
MSIVKLARPEIQELTAYQAAAQVDDTVRLNANESPLVSSGSRFRRPLNRYPEVRPQRLQDALANRFGCRREQLLVTRGSSEAIDLIIRSFCNAGKDNIVMPSPTFSMYRHYAQVQGAEVVEVEMLAENDFALDLAATLAACTEQTRVVFVCSPNNPTGTPVSRADLVRLIEARANKSAVVVDEAYIEFSDEASIVELLENYPNLIVLRTLSKALGFAGARCGAAIAAADVVNMLNAVQSPYALATPVVECIEDAMQFEQLTLADKNVNDIIAERKRVMALIGNYEFVLKVWPSAANFFLIRVTDADLVMERCREHKVLLRYFGGQLADCIRITVGSVADNNCLLQALDTLAAD